MDRFPTRRQKIAIAGWFIISMLANSGRLLNESFAFALGFIFGQIVMITLIVAVFGVIIRKFREWNRPVNERGDSDSKTESSDA
jgi:hypothetical protein